MGSPIAPSIPTLPPHDGEVLLFPQGMTSTLPLPPQPIQPPRAVPPLPPGCMNGGSKKGAIYCSLSPVSGCGFCQEAVHPQLISPEGISLVIHSSDPLQSGDHRNDLNDLPFQLQHEKEKDRKKIPGRYPVMQRLSQLFDPLLCEQGFISSLSMSG